MLELVISGGQSGSDQAGLRAAIACGIRTGGTAAQGWETEDGPAPWLEEWGLVECESLGYPARTAANATNAQLSILFGNDTSPGSLLLIKIERSILSPNRPPLLRVLGEDCLPEVTAAWIAGWNPRVINIAGNRESSNPGIGLWVEKHLIKTFRILRNNGGIKTSE